jgi:two-component system cell cycle sensor histidine kinase/response regulator CckA
MGPPRTAIIAALHRGDHPVDSAVRAGHTLLARADVERLLRGVALLVSAGALLAQLTGLAIGDRSAVISGGVALAFAPVMNWLVGKGWLGLATAGCSVLLLAIAVFVTVTGAGTRDVGMNVFAVAIICSGLLLRRRAALVMMGLIVVSGGMIGVAELLGWLDHPYARSTRIDQVADILILQGSVAALVALLSKTLYRSLERTLATERSYSQIFDAAHDAIIVADAETRHIVNVNESACRTFNRTREQMVGASIGAALAGNDEEARRIIEAAEAAVRKGDQRFEIGFDRTDGVRGQLEVSMQRATVGERARIVTVLRDISERRAIEKGLLEGEKLRVVGQLARGVAHDFNNQLTGILGSTTFLEAPLARDPAAREHLEVIKQSARRSAELVSQLLAFARKGKRRSDAVDCNQLIDEVEQLLRRSIDKRIQIVVHKASERVETVGDATLLQNALLNLALNARDAMLGGGQLTLSTGLVSIDDESRTGLPTELPNGPYACLSVVDTGPGMDEGTLAHIFEPFFTTKEAGNGMGLAAVYGTVQSHGGATRVDSKPGRGTRFELLLPAQTVTVLAAAAPATRTAAAPPPRAAEAPPVDLDGLHVLVVDDEPLVRQTTALLLERLGCRVQELSAGESALRIYRGEGPRHDLIILDHDMPGLSGTDTARQLRRTGVDVPILIVSGYGGEVVTESEDLVQGFLAKPFSPEQLAEAASAALQRGRASGTSAPTSV